MNERPTPLVLGIDTHTAEDLEAAAANVNSPKIAADLRRTAQVMRDNPEQFTPKDAAAYVKESFEQDASIASSANPGAVDKFIAGIRNRFGGGSKYYQFLTSASYSVTTCRQ